MERNIKILITGVTSGVGQALETKLLKLGYDVIGITRSDLDLSRVNDLVNYANDQVDMLINCAGTGVGGKIDFVHHNLQDITTIINTNLLAPVLLTHKVLSTNPKCKIVNITSTNNNRYWPNDLAYSLSKKALEEFGHMLRVEYPDISCLEVRLGLTKTNFNSRRYQNHPERFNDIYKTNEHLLPDLVADQITSVLFNDTIKLIEIAP